MPIEPGRRLSDEELAALSPYEKAELVVDYVNECQYEESVELLHMLDALATYGFVIAVDTDPDPNDPYLKHMRAQRKPG